jgi:hypothetical protein
MPHTLEEKLKQKCTGTAIEFAASLHRSFLFATLASPHLLHLNFTLFSVFTISASSSSSSSSSSS